jgi:branched-chain amino acid transport system substrate-binding protein
MKARHSVLALLPLLLGSPALAQGAAPAPIKLGFIVATSGPLKGVAEPSIAAFDNAISEINAAGGVNGRKVEAVRFDTGSDPRQASVGARKLAQDDGVVAIVGPFSSGEAAVTVNDAERLKILMMTPSASRPGLTDGKAYTWRLTEDEGTQFSRLLQAMKAKGIKMDKADIIYVSDEAVSNGAGTQSYPALFKAAGIAFDPPIPVQYKSFDVAPQVAKIVQSNPDVVAVAALPEAMSKIVRELRRQGYMGRIISSQIAADPLMVELLGKEGDGTLLVASFWKGHNARSMEFDKKFVAENEKRGIHKLGAHHSDAQTYDTVFLIKQLMEKAGTTGDPAKLPAERQALVDAIKGVRFSGVLGDDICFAGNDAELPGYIIEIKDGQWTKFDEAAANKCP